MCGVRYMWGRARLLRGVGWGRERVTSPPSVRTLPGMPHRLAPELYQPHRSLTRSKANSAGALCAPNYCEGPGQAP